MKLGSNACCPTCILEEARAMPYPLPLWGTHFSLTLASFLLLFFSSLAYSGKSYHIVEIRTGKDP